MKKKRFYQHSFSLMFGTLIFLLIVIAGIYTVSVIFYKLISSGKSTRQILIGILFLLISIFATVYSLYSFIIISKFRIEFDRDSIYIPNDWFSRYNHAQYKTRVKYDEISKIELIRSCRNSLNKKMRKNHYIAFANKPYLQLTLHNGQKKRFLLHFFKKDQWEEIIDELKHRLIATGNKIKFQVTEDMINAAEEDKAETLYKSLPKKLNKLAKKDSTGKLSDYLTYDEFCELFLNLDINWRIRYKDSDADYCLVQDNDKCIFFSEAKNFQQNYENPEELLAEAKIEGKSLKEAWDDLYTYFIDQKQ